MADRLFLFEDDDTDTVDTPFRFTGQRTVDPDQYGSSFVNFYNTALGLPDLGEETGVEVEEEDITQLAEPGRPADDDDGDGVDLRNILDQPLLGGGEDQFTQASTVSFYDPTKEGTITGFDSYSDYLSSAQDGKFKDRIGLVQNILEPTVSGNFKDIDLGAGFTSEAKATAEDIGTEVKEAPSRAERLFTGKLTPEDSKSLARGMVSSAGLVGAAAGTFIGGTTVKNAFGNNSFRPSGPLGLVADIVHSKQYDDLAKIRATVASYTGSNLSKIDTGFAVTIGNFGITRAPGSGTYTGNTRGMDHEQIKALEAISNGFDPTRGRYNMLDPSKSQTVVESGGIQVSGNPMDGFYRANGTVYDPRLGASGAYGTRRMAENAAANAGITYDQFQDALARARTGDVTLGDAIQDIRRTSVAAATVTTSASATKPVSFTALPTTSPTEALGIDSLGFGASEAGIGSPIQAPAYGRGLGAAPSRDQFDLYRTSRQYRDNLASIRAKYGAGAAAEADRLTKMATQYTGQFPTVSTDQPEPTTLSIVTGSRVQQDDDGFNAAQQDDDFDADAFAASYEDVTDFGFRQGGRVGLAMGGAPGMASGFVDRPPEQVPEDQTVADNRPAQLPEGAFVINAAAVEFAGSNDIKDMLLKAHKESIRRGLTVDKQGNGAKLIDVAISSGEVVVAPHLAKIIGYDRLNKINNRGKPETRERIQENGRPQAMQARPDGFINRYSGGDVSMRYAGPLSAVELMKSGLNVTSPVSQGFIEQEPFDTGPVPTGLDDTAHGYRIGDVMAAIQAVETKGYENKNGGYIFTKSDKRGKRSSAFGPYQITGETAADLLKRNNDVARQIKFDPGFGDYINAFISQGIDAVNIRNTGKKFVGPKDNRTSVKISNAVKKLYGPLGVGEIPRELHDKYYPMLAEYVVKQKASDAGSFDEWIKSYGNNTEAYLKKVKAELDKLS